MKMRQIIAVLSLAVLVSVIATPSHFARAQTPREILLKEVECDEGKMEACNWLGVVYERSKQYQKAAQRLTKACNGGLQMACSNLAEQYFDGHGVQQNHQRAFELFRGACKEEVLSGCAGYCIGLLKNVDLARDTAAVCQNVISKACETGNPWMCGHLGKSASPQVLSTDRRTCPDRAARVLARAFFLSNPGSGGNIGAHIAQNRSYFVEGGAAIRCAEALGTRLVYAGIKAYDPKAYERAMGVGPAVHAGAVADSINSGSASLWALGQELLWLGKVLPSAARGDWRPYRTTGTSSRQQIRQILPIYQQLMSMDPAMAQMVQGIMRQFQPIVEEQILMLARMLD